MTSDFLGDAFSGDGGLLLATIGPGCPGGCGGAGVVREWERMKV
jgi:hypothetical protein